MKERWLALAILAGVGCSGAGDAPKPVSLRKAPATVALEAKKIPRTLSYTGMIVAPHDATLSSTRGGRVDAYAFEVGQTVKAGELVVRLGASELVYASQAAAASAKVATVRIGEAKDPAGLPSALAAKANLETASDAARRAEKLHAQGSVSEQELNRTRTSERAAKAQYEAALSEARVEFGRLNEVRAVAGQAQAALGDKDIRAPFDGIVLDRFVEIGQVAAPNAPLLRVADPSELRVRFDMPQFDAEKVALGRSVRVLVDGKMLAAKVVRSTPGLVGEANARLVEAQIAEPPPGLLPGARVPAWLELGEEEELVEIPVAATTVTAGISRAWVLENDQLAERLLAVARLEGDRMLVRSGLRAGDRLVTAPRADFRIGEKVTP